MKPSHFALPLPRLLTLSALFSLWLSACEPSAAPSGDASAGDTTPDSVSLVACVGKTACTIVGEIQCKTGGAETRVCSVDPLSG